MYRLVLKRLTFIFFLSVFIISGCEEKKATDAKDFNKNLKSFNKSIDNVDKAMEIMDKMDKEIEKVEQLRKEGAISNSEARRRVDVLQRKYSRELVKASNANISTTLPEWAKRLGLTLPNNMDPDKTLSQVTSVNDNLTGYNSLTFVFKSDYNTAMKEAERIADNAGIPKGKDYKEAMALADELGIEKVKGAVYMNFEIGEEDDKHYHIAITVDETGILTITATDMYQLKKQTEPASN
jgi:hypothetical protein